MLDQTKEVYNIALTLSPIERIALIERLYFSLDSPELREQLDTLWAEEVEDRLTAFEKGDLKTIPAKAVFEKIDHAYQNKG